MRSEALTKAWLHLCPRTAEPGDWMDVRDGGVVHLMPNGCHMADSRSGAWLLIEACHDDELAAQAAGRSAAAAMSGDLPPKDPYLPW